MSETPNAMRFLDEQRERAEKKKAQRKGGYSINPNKNKGHETREKKHRQFNKPFGKAAE